MTHCGVAMLGAILVGQIEEFCVVTEHRVAQVMLIGGVGTYSPG